MNDPTTLPVARATLRILIVLNWLFGASILALLAISLRAEDWTWRALGVGAAAGRADVAAGMRAIMVLGIASAPVAHLVLRRLLDVVESVRAGNPFRVDNAARLRTIAWSLLGLQLLHVCVVAITSALAKQGVPLRIGDDVNLAGWLSILLLFVLAGVFLEGARMREDLEGTV